MAGTQVEFADILTARLPSIGGNYFATKAQGALASSAVQPDALRSTVEGLFRVVPVNDIAAMKALDTTLFTSCVVNRAGLRNGQWNFIPGNYTTQVALDVREGVFARSNTVDPSVGAWVRVIGVLNYVCSDWFGPAKNWVTDDRAALNGALAVSALFSSKVYVSAGAYGISGPLYGPYGLEFFSDHITAARISRVGNWGGDTLTVGNANDGCGPCYIHDMLIEQLHPGFGPAQTADIVDRQTANQSHIYLFRGSNARIERVWFQYGFAHVKVEGCTKPVMTGCTHLGIFDRDIVGRQETFAYLMFVSTLAYGYSTEPQVYGNYMGGGNSTVTKTVANGNAPFSSHVDASCYTCIYIEGCEGLHVNSNYIGASNENLFRFAAKSIVGSINIEDNFFDGARAAALYFGSAVDQQPTTDVTITNNRFNGQLISQMAIFAEFRNAGSGGYCCVAGISLSGNHFSNYLQSCVQAYGARVLMVVGNMFNNYHCRGGWDGTPAGCAGLYAGAGSVEVHSRNNWYGGGTNFGSDYATNFCKWGSHLSDGGIHSVLGDCGSLGMAGGALNG